MEADLSFQDQKDKSTSTGVVSSQGQGQAKVFSDLPNGQDLYVFIRKHDANFQKMGLNENLVIALNCGREVSGHQAGSSV